MAEICDQLGFPLLSGGTSEEVFYVFYWVIAGPALHFDDPSSSQRQKHKAQSREEVKRKTTLCPPKKPNSASGRIVLAMASSGAMVATYSGMAQQKREVNRE